MSTGWEIATDADGTVLRRRIAMRLESAMLSDWAAGLGAGFAETVGDAITVDAVAAAPAGSVRTLHTITDRHGRGHVATTLARPVADGSDITCHIMPMSRYARDLGSPAHPDGAEVRVEAHLAVLHGADRGQGTIARRADLVRMELPGATDRVWARASTLPGLFFANRLLGPRPRSEPRVVLIDRPSLVDVVTGAGSPPGRAAAALAALARDLTAWWSLEWIHGVVPESLAVDEVWHSATLATAGRLEILDAGDAGLWRVITQVPEPLRTDWEGDEEPVALRRTNATEVFAELVRLAG